MCICFGVAICIAAIIDRVLRFAEGQVESGRSASYPDWEPCGLLPNGQLLTAWQGLRMMTIEAARMLHLENDLGTLEPGKRADLVILSSDPLTVSPDRLTEIDVRMTWIDGVVEWEAPSS